MNDYAIASLAQSNSSSVLLFICAYLSAEITIVDYHPEEGATVRRRLVSRARLCEYLELFSSSVLNVRGLLDHQRGDDDCFSLSNKNFYAHINRV